jgi:hypothetical protein
MHCFDGEDQNQSDQDSDDELDEISVCESGVRRDVSAHQSGCQVHAEERGR